MSAVALATRRNVRAQAQALEDEQLIPGDTIPAADALPLGVIDFACGQLYQAIAVLHTLEASIGGDTQPIDHLPEHAQRAMRRVDALLDAVEESWETPGRPVFFAFEQTHFDARALIKLFCGAAFYENAVELDFKFDMDVTAGMLMAIRAALEELHELLQGCERLTEGAKQ